MIAGLEQLTWTKMSFVDWRTALAIVLAAIVWAHASTSGERETSRELVQRSLGHIRRGEISAVIPLFAPESLQKISLDQFVGAIQVLGLGDQIDSQLVTEESSYSAEGVPTDTIIFHLKGPDTALLVAGQVQDTESGAKLTGLSLRSAPLELSEFFPFVVTGLSYVHYYVLIALFCVPALMLYASVRCLRRESAVGWTWIPFILIGIGRATAVWVPGPPDERLFSFTPMAITLLGVGMQKVPAFEPWQVSVSAPLGAIMYLWWSGHRSRTQRELQPQESETASSLSG
jgi:hypothetical protein